MRKKYKKKIIVIKKKTNKNNILKTIDYKNIHNNLQHKTKNIISFSLYGTKEIYWKGALANIELAKKIYPEYVCRFYIDQNSPQHLKDSIVGDNVEKIFMKNHGGIDGMFWRFLGSIDYDVSIFLCRDADSRLSLKEKAAVDEWLQSDKNFHIMRDHPIGHKKKIMGGMWGCRNHILLKLNFEKLISNYFYRKKYGDDQKFLADKVYPLIRDDVIEHSDYNIKYANAIKPFPLKGKDDEFVGKIYTS